MSVRSVAHDIKYAIRGMLSAPGFSLAAIIALGLAIGANTAIFSVVDAVLLRPLSYSQSDQLAWIPVLVVAVTAAASYVPARRAARIDPVAALRHQ